MLAQRLIAGAALSSGRAVQAILAIGVAASMAGCGADATSPAAGSATSSGTASGGGANGGGANGGATSSGMANGGSGGGATGVGGSGGGGQQLAASPFFGLTTNDTTAYPNVSYGIQRIWDSPPFQWANMQTAACPDITTCAGGYDTANMDALDTFLAHLPTIGVHDAIYTMARTPHFITAFPNDPNCSYSGNQRGGGGLGQCDRPIDLADDGSGTNETFRMWYAFLAKRLTAPSYVANHAHVRYWEIWNEPDDVKFWSNGANGHGSYAGLVRMAEDMRCMLTGKGVVHNYPTAGANGGQGVTCAAAGLPALDIDSSALIMSPSYHAEPVSLVQMSDFLYCNQPTHDATCNTGSAGAAAVDILTQHMKPGQDCVPDPTTTPPNANCTPATQVEDVLTGYLSNVRSYLQPNELAKAIFDDEGGYNSQYWTAPYLDNDMAASYVPRYLLMAWSLDVANITWYPWDGIGLSSQPLAVTAWSQTYEWLVGSTLTAPCAATGTIWSCSFTKASKPYLVLWDVSKNCSGGTCTRANQSVPSTWTKYQDMTTASAPAAIVAHAVPVGVKPVLLQ